MCVHVHFSFLLLGNCQIEAPKLQTTEGRREHLTNHRGGEGIMQHKLRNPTFLPWGGGIANPTHICVRVQGSWPPPRVRPSAPQPPVEQMSWRMPL